MKKFALLFLFFSPAQFLLAQDSIALLKKEMLVLKKEIKKIKSVNAVLTHKIDTVRNVVKTNADSLQNISGKLEHIKYTGDKLNIKLEHVNADTNQKFYELNDYIKTKTQYWMLAFLMLSLLSAIMFYLLRKRISNEKTETEKQIVRTRKALQEEGIKLDSKLIEILEAQLKLLSSTNKIEDIDHSLALKVADELLRIQKYFAIIDQSIKGIKHLADSVQRIKDNFKANGYEIPDLLNKHYDYRMKLVVREKIPDENLSSGEEIITRIIKPQVNYNGVMIQSAQVDVSVG